MSDSESIPSDIEEEAFRAISGLLPARSKQKYEYTYSKYEKWCTEKKVHNYGNEKVLITYFSNLVQNKCFTKYFFLFGSHLNKECGNENA